MSLSVDHFSWYLHSSGGCPEVCDGERARGHCQGRKVSVVNTHYCPYNNVQVHVQGVFILYIVCKQMPVHVGSNLAYAACVFIAGLFLESL